MRRLPLFAAVVLALGSANGCRRLDRLTDDSAAQQMPLAQLSQSAAVPRADYGRLLEPAGNVILHGAGQSDELSFAHYSAAVAPARPLLMMRYLDLRDDVPAFFARLTRDLAAHTDLLIPQIGVSLNAGDATRHYEADTARGADDARIAELCTGLHALDRPSFLRIGYEFNGPWNGYESHAYVAAYRRIATAVRQCAANKVALVWDWSADAELDLEHAGLPAQFAADRWREFYPGDAYVDWWGLNLFSPATLNSRATWTFLRDADAARFPVMIAESTLRGSSIGSPEAIDGWFAPYFGLLRSARAVKAFCYIDWDWRRYPQWAAWGDARIESNPTVAAFVRQQVNAPLFAGPRDRGATLRMLRAR